MSSWGQSFARATASQKRRKISRTSTAAALAGSTTARTLIGDAFVDHFAATRRWEVNQSRSAVTDWEIARYLEHI